MSDFEIRRSAGMGCGVVVLAFWVLLIGTVAIVAFHFIRKVW